MLAAALLIQAFVLYRAFHYGPMAGLIPWDDCLTLQRGLHNLRVLVLAATPLNLIALIPDLVIHSPVSDLQALGGLLVGGGALWVPYALNIGALLLALYAVLFRTGRQSLAVFAALALAFLVQPLTIDSLTFLKADWKGGLLIAAALYTLYEAAEQERRDLKLLGAGILGLGVAAKLTAFYMPVFAFVALIGFEALSYFARHRDGLAGFRAHLNNRRAGFGLALILALGPFLVFFLLGALGRHRIVAYIAYAVGDTWSDGRNPLQRALYYSPFTPGGGHWGLIPLFALAFVGGALVVSVMARRRFYPIALALMAGLALMLLVPLAAAHTSNWEFGAGLLGVVLGAVLVSIRVFARDLPRCGPLAALIMAGCLALTAPLRPPFLDPDVGQPTTAELQRLKGIYVDIARDIALHTPTPAPKVRLFYENGFAPFPDLSLLYFHDTGQLIDVDRIDDIAHPEAIKSDLASADFLLTMVSGAGARMRGLPARFPTSADPGGADRFVAAQPGFLPMRRYPLPDGEIRLYQRRATASHP